MQIAWFCIRRFWNLPFPCHPRFFLSCLRRRAYLILFAISYISFHIALCPTVLGDRFFEIRLLFLLRKNDQNFQHSKIRWALTFHLGRGSFVLICWLGCGAPLRQYVLSVPRLFCLYKIAWNQIFGIRRLANQGCAMTDLDKSKNQAVERYIAEVSK